MATMFFFSVLMSARIRFRQRITEKKKKILPSARIRLLPISEKNNLSVIFHSP